MAYPSTLRRISGLIRYTIIAVGTLALLFYFRQMTYVLTVRPGRLSPVKPNLSNADTSGRPRTKLHPIEELIDNADKTFEALLAKQTFDLKSAASEYRKRRGRHPPPWFDLWFEFAGTNKALIVEEFFDQIYHDLAPFWGVDPSLMRKKAESYEMRINIRNHKASAESTWFWTQIWLDMIKTIEHLLPDMDIALNAMDEPRIVIPWEEINKYMEAERKTRKMPPATEVVSNFRPLKPPGKRDQSVIKWEPGESASFWKIVTRGCHPDSLARNSPIMTDFDHRPSITSEYTTSHMYKGFVSNYTASTDFCNQPDLQYLHGIMIKPLTISSTKDFFPMFGGSKLHTNNEILLPAPMYWNNEERFSGGYDHGGPWDEKLNKVIWRGVATGGRSQADNWKGFQRHRFVAMTNATKISDSENSRKPPENWVLPPTQYNLAAQAENRLGEWTREWADTGFVDLNCEPSEIETCEYSSSQFSILPGMMMSEQFFRKYLPDIDGNSFSGRYRGFLLSTSLPIKSTVFREWHDSRLVPWKHFVPMDNRFIDFWGIIQYFLGYQGKTIQVDGHDEQARKIAMDGQDWANKVLRTEDMQIYVLRLLLEYARLSDDRRDGMGWVGDLV